MGSNEGHTAKPDNQENYEAAVLEFLDKEMAAVKPASKNDQSDELDALVSDLLKQVITESDQPKDTRQEAAEVSEEESLLAEFPPTEVGVSPPSSTVQSTAAAPAAAAPPTPAEIEDESTEKPEETAPEIQESINPSAHVFPPPAPAKRKILMMSIAAAFLVAIIGIGSYHFYFSNSLKSVSSVGESQPDAPVPPATEAQNQAAPVSTQTGSNVKMHQAIQPAADKASAAQSPGQAPAVPVQKPAASNTEPGPAAVSQAVIPAKTQPEPAQSVPAAKPVIPTVNNGEKPATAPITQTGTPVNPPAPAVAAASPADEKLTPASDVAEQEKRPAPPAPVATPGIENSAPVSQPPAQAPVVSRTLIPAVAISQVSPAYPEAAIRSRISAAVVIDLQIDAQGKVVKATPVSGPVIFHNAAITAVMKWRYKPASIGGNNVASQSKVTLNFNIQK